MDDQWRQDYLRMNDEREDYNKYYRDEDIDKRINKINDRLTKLNEYINTDRDDMEFWQGLLNQVDSIYKPSDEWEDAKKKHWLYQIPAGIASSAPSMASNLAAYGAATLLGAAGSFAGPAGTAAGVYLGMSLMTGSTLLSRNQESLAEVSGMYKGKIYDFLNAKVGTQVLSEDVKGNETFITIAQADAELFTNLVKTVKEKKEQIDEIILNSFSKDWDKDRIEILLQNILRTGIAEFFIHPDLDSPIIINEYVDITRSFYDGAEVRLVNAVLDKFSQTIRS